MNRQHDGALSKEKGQISNDESKRTFAKNAVARAHKQRCRHGLTAAIAAEENMVLQRHFDFRCDVKEELRMS
jgi:hypothetical protein